VRALASVRVAVLGQVLDLEALAFRRELYEVARPTGDRVLVTVELDLSRKIPQGKEDDGKPLFEVPGSPFGATTCTIVAV